jgi:hypothetical protein
MPRHLPLAMLGVMLLIGAPNVVAADTAGPSQYCSGDPELGPRGATTEFICGEIWVELAGSVKIATVVARSAPSATIVRRDGPRRMWLLRVPKGTEVAVRDALQADRSVAYVSLTYIGYIEPWFAHTGRESPDAKYPTAGICLPVQPGSAATFTIAMDTAQPRCGEVRPAQHLRIVNEGKEIVRVTFHFLHYVIRPGKTLTFGERFGDVWEPGVHNLRYSVSGVRSGIDVVLVRDFPNTAMEPPHGSGPLTHVGISLLCLGMAFAVVRRAGVVRRA